MDGAAFPPFIMNLPEPIAPIAAIRGRLLRGETALAMFYDAPEETIEIAEHAHGAQWGVVLEGRVDLEIDGTLYELTPGKSYSIPAGVLHRATIHRGTVAIDVFADADRYDSAPSR